MFDDYLIHGTLYSIEKLYWVITFILVLFSLVAFRARTHFLSTNHEKNDRSINATFLETIGPFLGKHSTACLIPLSQ